MGKLFEARVKLFKCKLPTPQSIEQSASTFSLTFQSIEGNVERARKCEVKIAQFTQLHQFDLFRLPTPTDSLNERRDVKEKYRKLNFVYVNHLAMSLDFPSITQNETSRSFLALPLQSSNCRYINFV